MSILLWPLLPVALLPVVLFGILTLVREVQERLTCFYVLGFSFKKRMKFNYDSEPRPGLQRLTANAKQGFNICSVCFDFVFLGKEIYEDTLVVRCDNCYQVVHERCSGVGYTETATESVCCSACNRCLTGAEL